MDETLVTKCVRMSVNKKEFDSKLANYFIKMRYLMLRKMEQFSVIKVSAYTY